MDSACATVLAGFPAQLHRNLRWYVEARRVLNEGRDAVTMAKIPQRIEWYQIDRALAGL
jgi:hypothetical protein